MFYKHYKGGLYRVIGEAKHTETGEDLVVYISAATGQLWVRPAKMFYEMVEMPGSKKLVPRFRKV